MCMCFRAMGTKAAPGKGREFRCKWKNLSWVLQNLSFMDFSASLGQKAAASQKGRKVPILGHYGLSSLIPPKLLKTLG